MREITGQAVRAGEIIRKLRGLATRSDAESAPTNINRLVSELTDLLKSSTKVHDVQYQLELGTDLPDLKIQAAEIQQVIMNLVRNAIESFPQDSTSVRRIVIKTLSTGDGDVEVCVSDNGPGVAAQYYPVALCALLQFER